MASRRSSSESREVRPRRGRKPKSEVNGVSGESVYELTDKGKAMLSSLESEEAHSSSEAPKSSILTGPSRLDGQLYFTGHDRLLYENKQLLVKSGLQNIALKRLEIAQLKSQFDERIRQAQQELTSVTTDAKAAESALRSLQEEIERVYAVDLQKIAYDPDTGRISIPPSA